MATAAETPKAVEAEPMTLQELPDELKLKILSFVPCRDLYGSVMELNGEWRNLGSDYSLWRSVEFEPSDDAEVVRKMLARHCEAVERVKILSDSTISEILRGIFVDQIRLKELLLRPTCAGSLSLSLIDVFWLLQLSRGLESLSIRAYRIPEIPRDLGANPGPPSSLISLDLSECTGIDDQHIQAIVAYCPMLEYLDIDYLEYLSSSSIRTVADGLPRLRALYIDGEKVDDDAYEYLLSRHAGLEAFGVSYARQMSNRTFLMFAKMPNLQFLKVRHGELLTAPSIVRCFAEASFPLLKTLNLQYCDGLNQDCLKTIAACCRALEWFSAVFFDTSDEGVMAFVDSCPKLKALDVTGIPNITGHPWLATVGDRLPGLQFVDFTMCTSLDGDLLARAAKRYPKITMLDYYGQAAHSEDPEVVNVCRFSFEDVLMTHPSLGALKEGRVQFPNFLTAALRRDRDKNRFLDLVEDAESN